MSPAPATTPVLHDQPRIAAAPPTLEDLIAGQQERVARLAWRLLGWRQDVDDVVQDVFVKACGGLHRFRGESEIATWLTRITINVCRTHARRRWLRMRWFTPGADAALRETVAADVPREPDERESEQVRSAVRALPQRDREVLVLRYFEDLPIERIAEVLGIGRNVVEVRLTRARQRLRGVLGERLETGKHPARKPK